MSQLIILSKFNKIVIEAFLNISVTSEKFVGELEEALVKCPPIDTYKKLLINCIDIIYDNGDFRFVSDLKDKELSFKILDILSCN